MSTCPRPEHEPFVPGTRVRVNSKLTPDYGIDNHGNAFYLGKEGTVLDNKYTFVEVSLDGQPEHDVDYFASWEIDIVDENPLGVMSLSM